MVVANIVKVWLNENVAWKSSQRFIQKIYFFRNENFFQKFNLELTVAITLRTLDSLGVSVRVFSLERYSICSAISLATNKINVVLSSYV